MSEPDEQIKTPPPPLEGDLERASATPSHPKSPLELHDFLFDDTSILDHQNASLEEEEEEEEEDQIFRQISLERRRHPDQLDSLLVVVNPAYWIALGGLYFILAIIIAWAFFGSIPLIAKGKGIFMTQQGGTTVQALLEGIVQRIHVSPGDFVSKGTLIAEIFDPKEDLKYRTSQIKVENLTKNLEQLQAEVKAEREAARSSVEKEIAAKEFTIQQKELRVKTLTEDIEKKQQLLIEGIISAALLREDETKLIQENIDIENAKAGIETLKSSLVKGTREEEIKGKIQEMLKATEERDLLRTSLESSKIYAPIDGEILELYMNIGDLVTLGKALVWMETPPSDKNPLVVYGYFPVENAKDLKKGQSVEIIISKDTKLQGSLDKVSLYPISSETLLRTFHSKALEEYLTSGENAAVYAMIDLKRDSSGQLVMQLFGGKSKIHEISVGTVCVVQAITSRVRPIYYLLPIEQFKQQ